jgi:uncharacterized protein (TIGR03086 family)
MTETADRYRRLSSHFADLIAGVPDGAWDDPTPCSDWSVLELVTHVVDSQGLFLGLVGREKPSVDVAADPSGAWRDTSGAVEADLDDPERAAVEFEGFFGTQTFEAAVDRFLCMDLVVHGWDLAHATGQAAMIGADELARVEAGARAFGDALRTPGVFGEPIDVPAGADEQTRVLAFLGRTA